MPNSSLDSLRCRFGDQIAAAIAEAYEAAVTNYGGPDGSAALPTELRLSLVQALIREAEGGWVDLAHLKSIAFTVVADSNAAAEEYRR